MEKFITDEAIVLKKTQVGDTDLSINIYAKNIGRTNIYIPKGQLIKTFYPTIMEPFNWFKGVFVEKKGKFFIKEINQFQNLALPISQNLDKFYTAFYILSIFNKYSISDDEKLFILLKKSFYYLTIIENTENFKINFLAKFILLSGIYPQLDECVKCKSKINVKNFSSFSVKHSGAICKNCNKRKKSFLTYKDILTLKALKKAPFSKIDSLSIENKNFLHFFEKYISSKMES